MNNPNGIYPLWTTTSTEGPEAGNESNSNYVQDGSYLRMQTLTLGYSLPKKLLKKIGFEKIRVYGQISNVFTITGYDGLDPEVRSHTSFENEYVSSDMNKGIDYWILWYASSVLDGCECDILTYVLYKRLI